VGRVPWSAGYEATLTGLGNPVVATYHRDGERQGLARLPGRTVVTPASLVAPDRYVLQYHDLSSCPFSEIV